MTIKAENLEMRPIADRQWVDQCPPGDRREVKHESGTGCITWVVDRRGPVMDASLALPLTQGASNSALAKLANAAKASINALRGFADQAAHDLEAELASTPNWRWLKRRTLKRQLSKARYQYAVMGGAP